MVSIVESLVNDFIIVFITGLRIIAQCVNNRTCWQLDEPMQTTSHTPYCTKLNMIFPFYFVDYSDHFLLLLGVIGICKC